jgi:hypothetical protein
MATMEARKNNNGDAVLFMALKFLCRFLLFGMNMLLWMLLDVGGMYGEGVAKPKAVGKNLSVEWKKNKQQNR